MNNAPFYIGQKVVCITGSDYIKRDKEYIISDCYFSTCCKKWYASVGIFELDPSYRPICPLHNVEHVLPLKNSMYHNAKYFAPIEENTYEDCTKDLAKLPVEETPDVKKIKEIVSCH